ncbi:MAG TPA: MFS transporter [Acetobacteraceae bacterium]|jgi:MFS family permease|nr:MFS transporter [Acetobacteraceae bacterium]
MTSRSAAGLDWLTFFVANVQTGFGPFIAVYLTSMAWTQTSIGEALSLGTVVAMVSQVPGGALVDRLRDKRVAALLAAAGVALAALLFALAPTRPAVLLAMVLHSLASSMLGPAIAAISLALVGRAALGERLGRNTRFAALGNGSAAAVLGVVGAYVSSRAVFWLTSALMIPGLIALSWIRRKDLTKGPASLPRRASTGWMPAPDLWRLFRDRRLLVFVAAAVLFFFNDAALLPIAGAQVTKNSGSYANLVIAASIVLPQLISAAIAPWVGRSADRWGRRPMLLLGFASVPVRGLLLALSVHPGSLILVQGLDGLSASVFGVMMPLVIADITAGTQHFNKMVGVVGLAISGGAALSTLVAGILADTFGHAIVFLVLSSGGLVSVLLLFLAMPDTRGVTVRPREPVAA